MCNQYCCLVYLTLLLTVPTHYLTMVSSVLLTRMPNRAKIIGFGNCDVNVFEVFFHTPLTSVRIKKTD